MKIKKDFITNSSSVAFICDVCGREESGMDIGLYEVGMYSCENGHYFCVEHLVNPEDNEIEDRYEILSKFCPICQF